jgi:hypothetical protein
MALSWGSSLSNYFKVKDIHAFKTWLSEIGHVGIAYEWNDSIAIIGDYFGGWPDCRGQGHVSFDFVEELSGFLAEGEIAVLIDVGAEDRQYIGGTAIAVDSRGRSTRITLSDIYARAEAVLGHRPQTGPYCSITLQLLAYLPTVITPVSGGPEDDCYCEDHPRTHSLIIIVPASPNSLSSDSFHQFACSASLRRSAEASDRETASSLPNKSAVFNTAPSPSYSFKSFYHESHI